MRNLKKVLSLVLALMMVLSVMVTASAADFADADSITYKEAVDVLAAAGVLNGVKNDDGTYSFLPTDTLNREAAAKMVTYIKLGGDVDAAVADALVNPFTDVSGWSTNVIKYCYSEGIVAGVDATSFLPKDYLTGYAYAKMLLVAAGINGEYTGTQWKANVYTAAKNNGLLAGLENVVLSGNLTREQAAQMTVNALFASSAGSLVYVLTTESGEIEFTDLQEALLFKAAVGGELSTRRPTSGVLASNLNLDTKYYENELGLNVHVWTIKGKVVTDEYVDDAYVTTYATGTAYSKIAADLGVTKENNKVSAKWYANGEYKETLDVVSYLDSKLGTQAPVAVYADGANSYKLLATVEYLATATVAKNAEKSGENKGLYKVDFAVENGYTETVYAAKDEYVDGAKYLVVPQGDDTTPNGLLSVVAASSVTVNVSAMGTGYVRSGNDTYYAAPGRVATAFKGISLADKDRTWVLWLSSEGTVITATRPVSDVVVTPETLVYVTGYYNITTPATPGSADKYGNVTGGTEGYVTTYAQGVDVDGKEVTYPVKVDFTTSTDVGSVDNSVVGKMVAVEYNPTTKVYSFTTATTATELQLVEGKISVNGYYYNTATYTSVSGSLNKLVVAPGNLKGAVNAGTAWVVFTTNPNTTNKTVTKVFYAETYVAPETTYSYAILADDGVSTISEVMSQKNAAGEDIEVVVYTHNVYINDKVEPIKTYSNTMVKGMYKYAVDEYGVYELVELKSDVYEGKITNVYGSYVTGAGMNDYDITGVELVDLREGEAADGKLEIGDSVIYYAVDTNYDKVVDITVIYIVG